MQLFKKNPRSGAFYPVGQPASKVDPPKPENRTTVTFIAYRTFTDPLDNKLNLFFMDVSKCPASITTNFSYQLSDVVGFIQEVGFSHDKNCVMVRANVKDEYLTMFPAIGYSQGKESAGSKLMQVSLTHTPTDTSIPCLFDQMTQELCLWKHPSQRLTSL